MTAVANLPELDRASRYVILLSLSDLLDAVAANPGVVHLQVASVPEYNSGIPIAQNFVCYITAPITDGAGMTIHALYLRLEAISRGAGREAAVHTAAAARVEAIEARLREQLENRGATVLPGITLVPGLRGDLSHYGGAQHLWRIRQADPNDPLSRRLEWL